MRLLYGRRGCARAPGGRARHLRGRVGEPHGADEPTGNLDLRTGSEIIDLLCEMRDEKGVTIITATHDTKMIAASGRVVWIADGAIERIQPRDELDVRVTEVGDRKS